MRLPFIFLTLAIVLISCDSEPAEKYAEKVKIGELDQIFGMAPFKVCLYENSTFYLPSEGTNLKYSEETLLFEV